jgi:hypothetical protein
MTVKPWARMWSITRAYTLSHRWFFTIRMSMATVARWGMMVLASAPTNPLDSPRIVSVGWNMMRSR